MAPDSLATPPAPLQVIHSVTEPVDSVESTEAPAQVLRQFRQVFGAVRNHFHQIEKKAGIGGSQVWALSEIRRSPGLSMNGLAGALDVHQSTASNLVRQLVTRGLVRTEKSTLDRRGVCLYLEPAAEALLLKVPGPHQGLLPLALANLSPQALQQLSQGLAELIGSLALDDTTAQVPLADL